MSALEDEIIEKFHQLDKDAQNRVRALIEQETKSDVKRANAPFDHAAWFRDIEALRQQIRAEHDDKFPQIDVVEMLREIRDGEDE